MPDERKMPKTYTVHEVADILRRTPQTIRRFIKEGKLPAIRVGGGYIVTEETINRVLSGELNLRD